MSNNGFLRLEQVTKNFKDPASDIYFQALRGIDLKIKKGTLSSIIGPSGAGKSTLLRCILKVLEKCAHSTNRTTRPGQLPFGVCHSHNQATKIIL